MRIAEGLHATQQGLNKANQVHITHEKLALPVNCTLPMNGIAFALTNQDYSKIHNA